MIDSAESVYIMMRTGHRRRIKTEEKANVVDAVWGTEENSLHGEPREEIEREKEWKGE